MRKLPECLSEFPGKTAGAVIKNRNVFFCKYYVVYRNWKTAMAKKFLRNLENMDTVCYMSGLGDFPGVFADKTKQRVYDEKREFLGSYKTVLRKKDTLRKVIGGALEEGLVSGPFPGSELSAERHQVILNSSCVSNQRSHKTRCQNTGRCSARRCQPIHSSYHASYKT